MVHDYLQTLASYRQLEKRIDFIGRVSDSPGHLFNVLNGSHVLIDIGGNLDNYIEIAQRQEGVCAISLDEFRRSKEIVFTSPGAWMVRKGLGKTADQINQKLMWLEAFGLCDRIKRNHEIWSNEKQQPCLSHLETGTTSTKCEREENRVGELHAPLTLVHFRLLLKFCGICFALAAFLFLTERLVFPRLVWRLGTIVCPSLQIYTI